MGVYYGYATVTMTGELYRVKKMSGSEEVVPSVLALHAFTGCDSVAATYGNDKTKTTKVSRQGRALHQLGQCSADPINLVKQIK